MYSKGRWKMNSEPSAEQDRAHGRYYLEHVRLDAERPQQVQELLDEKDGREWHLVGVASGSPRGNIMLFWDTRKSSFGRRSY
jgi:hypothetical protein